ncbi:MAG: hypothetical protein WKF58_16905 [Ilumatobacteraceae bacterium]
MGQRTGRRARRFADGVRRVDDRSRGQHDRQADLARTLRRHRCPLTAGPDDGSPRFSPDGRALAFTSKRSEKKGETTLHVLPVDGPGEVRTVCAMPDGVSEVRWSPDGSWLAFTSRTQDERYEEDDDSSRSPRKVERFFSRLNGENWVFDRPQHVYVVSSSGSGTPRNLTPGEFQHSGISWLPDSSAVVTSGARHDTWDLDLATDLFLVTLDGEITEITHQTGRYESPVVSPDGTKVAFVGERHLDLDPQNAHVGVVDLPAGGEPRWISDALDRTFWTMSCTQAPVWQDDDTVLAVAEDRGETHLYRVRADGGATPEALTKGPDDSAGLRHGWWYDTRRDRRRRPSRRARRARRRHHVADDTCQRMGAVRRADDRRHERDRRLDHAARRTSTRTRRTRCCSTCTADRTRSTARRSSTRRRCRPPPASWS